jgi:hypothetical protein
LNAVTALRAGRRVDPAARALSEKRRISRGKPVLALLLANPFYVGRDGLVCIAVVMVIVFLATSTRRSARRCPRCHEINREPAIFCAQCGARLPGR